MTLRRSCLAFVVALIAGVNPTGVSARESPQLSRLLFGDDIDRAVSEFGRLIDELGRIADMAKEQSDKWRDQVNITINDLNWATNQNIVLARKELQDLVSSTVTTADCGAQFYIHKLRLRLGDLVKFLRSGKVAPPIVAVCGADTRAIDLASDSAAIIQVYGFGFRSAILGEAASVEFRVQRVLWGGRTETLDDKTIVQVPSPYRLALNFTGPNAKYLSSAVQTIQVISSAKPDEPFAPVILSTPRKPLPIDLKASPGNRGEWPSARATALDGYVLVGGGCESSLSDRDGGQLLVWSYPDGKSWVCQATEHSVFPLPATLTAHALVAKLSDLPDLVVQPFPKTSDVRDDWTEVTQAATVPAGWTLLGGGCKTSWSEQSSVPRNVGRLHLTGSYSSGPSEWTCTAATVGNEKTTGSLTTYAIGAQSRSLELTSILREKSSRASEKPVVADFFTNRVSQERSLQRGQHVRVVGGGCKFDNGQSLFMTKPFPVLSADSAVRGWRCVFASHGVPGLGDVEASVQGAFEIYRPSK